MPLKKLLVTSALPKEGKSFTTANLAQVMVRQPGRRALMIDADLRGPQLHQMLGTLQGPGLSEYLLGEADESSVIQRGPMEGLYFIPSGEAIEDPTELVASCRLKILFQRIEPLFDWIIIDSPPAIPVCDASILAKACDGVLIVVRSASTPADLARKVRLEFPEEMLVGVVVNGSDAGWSQRAAATDETGATTTSRCISRISVANHARPLATGSHHRTGVEPRSNPAVGIGSVSAPNISFDGGPDFNSVGRWRAGFSDKEFVVGSTLVQHRYELATKNPDALKHSDFELLSATSSLLR
jgi:protein-tyrosine kinase